MIVAARAVDWLVMLAVALACAALAYASTRALEPALALGAAGAALAGAVRALVGATRAASIIAAACGALLATACLLAFIPTTAVHAALAAASAMFALAELARPAAPDRSPWPLIAAAVVAAALDPSFAALVVVGGAWLVRQPRRPRAAVAVPVVGGLILVLAGASACASGGVLAHVWRFWATPQAGRLDASALALRLGDALGPVVAVAALIGLALAATRARLVAVAVLVCSVGALLVAWRVGAVTTAAFAVASMAAAVALGQLAGMVRHGVGQAFVAATAAVLLVGGPAWALAVSAGISSPRFADGYYLHVTRDDWMRRLGPLYGGAVALVNTTAWRWPTVLGDEVRSPGWIVAVGVPMGVLAWVVGALVHALGTPASIGALFALAMLAASSAGLAERGLADRIERHARTPGATTVVALVLFTLVRAAAIVAVAPAHWLGVLVATAVVGRWCAVFLQAIGDPVDDAESRSLVATPAPAWLVAALGLGAIVIAGLALGKAGVVAVATAAGASFALGVDAQRRDRGLSAPVVATAAGLGELIVLVASSIVG